MQNSLRYRFCRIFWSIYFVLGITVIGLLFGYVLTFALFLLAFAFSFWPEVATKIRHGAEWVQCASIRMLLKMQPWLRCESNLPGIYGFYDQFHTRKVLFVANHRSNLDTFLLISYIPGLRGLAKSSLFYNIFFAPFMWVAGFIPVDKGSADSFLQGLKLLKTKLLDRQRPVLIFPENTRCEKGFPSLRKFSAAIFSTAIESQALIIPVVMKNTDQLLGRGDFWLNPFQPVEVKMLTAIPAQDHQDPQALRDLVWSQIQGALA